MGVKVDPPLRRRGGWGGLAVALEQTEQAAQMLSEITGGWGCFWDGVDILSHVT